MQNNKLWYNKYLPKTLDEYVFPSEEFKVKVSEWVDKEKTTLPNLLLVGPFGTGKTALSRLIVGLLDISALDFREINASSRNSINDIRSDVEEMARSCPVDSPFKVVLLEEADRLSPEAQDALRDIIGNERYPDVRFILTGNHPHRISDGLKSRCRTFELNGVSTEKMGEKALDILQMEEIKVKNPDDLFTVLERAGRDMRKMVDLLEEYSTTGTLTIPEETSSDANVETGLFILECIDSGYWTKARDRIHGEALTKDDCQSLLLFMMDYVAESKTFSEDENLLRKAMVVINDYSMKHELVISKPHNLLCCVIALTTLGGK